MPPIIAILANQQQTAVGDFSLHDFTPRAYVDALLAAGGVPFILPLLDDAADVAALLDRADGLLVTGGADVSPDLYGEEPVPALGSVTPLRDQLDQIALRLAGERNLPVLGICRGIQSMAVFAGGSLAQDIPSQIPAALQHSQKAPGWYTAPMRSRSRRTRCWRGSPAARRRWSTASITRRYATCRPATSPRLTPPTA